MHTTDGGTTWTQQYVESGGSSVFFTDANTGTIVGGGGTILRTTNGGATWTPQSSGTTQHLESVFFTDANTGTAVGGEYGEAPDSTILRTTDGGTTWTRQYVNTFPWYMMPLFSVFFTDANTGTVVGELGTILRTTDGGQTWIPQEAPPYNGSPSVNAGRDQTITLPSSANLVGTVSDDGLPNPPGALTTTWSKVSGPGTVTFGNANAVNTTASFSAAGSYVLRLTASDSALQASDDISVAVNSAAPSNRAPSVNAGPDQTITLPGVANLDGTVSDDGLPKPPGAVTTTWSKVSGPGTVTFGNANAVDTMASFSAAGSYVLRLTASDSALQASDDISVTVNSAAPSNRAPSVNAGPDQTITLPGVANLDGTVSDDGLPKPPGAVTTTWSKVSGPGTVTLGNANAVDTTASFSVAGNYVLRLTVNDGALQASDDIRIRVRK